MRVVAVLLLLAACDGGKAGTPEAARAPAAMGSLVFTPRSVAETDVFLATEAEVIKSRRILDQVADRFRVSDLTADAITVRRRPGTAILDVRVRMADLDLAATRCNQVMQTYFEFRWAMLLEDVMQPAAALADKLERDPDNAALKQQLADLDARRMTTKSDVRVLEPCRPPGRRP